MAAAAGIAGIVLPLTARSDGGARRVTSEQLENHEMWLSLPSLTLKSRCRARNVEEARTRSVGSARRRRLVSAVAGGPSSSSSVEAGATRKVIHGKCFVVGDNIDTDQIIPAEYLTLVPSNPDEYEKLGSYAMIGLPGHYGAFIEAGKTKTDYTVMIGGANFGCGSSREHAPVAMGAAGIRAVVAESFARIFFRNSVATGELYPVESESRICEENRTGDLVTVDLEHDVLINHTAGKQFSLVPIGDAGPVIDAGGIFNFARASGMIASPVS